MTSADLAEMLESSASDFKEANERAAYPIIEIWAESAINLADLLRQAAARLRSMEEALKEAHEAINLAMTIAQGRFPATARKAPLEVLADAERKARAALAGAVRTSRKTLSGEGQ